MFMFGERNFYLLVISINGMHLCVHICVRIYGEYVLQAMASICPNPMDSGCVNAKWILFSILLQGSLQWNTFNSEHCKHLIRDISRV